MARAWIITRDEAELLVDLLERNLVEWHEGQYGRGADLAVELRELFGMGQFTAVLEPKPAADPSQS
jgi:hypothetical protein